jgi:DNA-binding XRE family transcriptional regulator
VESFDDAERRLATRLGDEIRRLRERNYLTQSVLARKAGHYSRSTIATVETGWGKCSLKLIQGCDDTLEAGGALVRIYLELKETQTRRKEEARSAFRSADRSARRSSDGDFILVPSLEPALVDRSHNLESLVAILVEASAEEPAKPVAVCGPGGFGKTTLATQACHDARVRELFSEILWVETGEDCTTARAVELVSDLCVHLDGARPALSDAEQAGFHLARVLGDRRVLLVIDNVWSAADLAPFLFGGPRCVRLVTSRNVRVCPSTTRLMRLGPMSPHEINELLRRGISAPAGYEARGLAELCGGWPLLATVVGSNIQQDVGAGAPLSRAVRDAGEVLAGQGPQAFDVWDADQRRTAIGHAIMSSLRSLDEHVTIAGGSALQDRYLSLAIFPAATPVPLDVLTHWWQRAYGWSRSAVRQFCRVLADRSLVSAYLADRDAILLHDVFRGYLRHLLGDEWAASHRSLIDAYRASAGDQWLNLGDEHGYVWRHLSFHLHFADLDDELVGTLASPVHVVSKVVRVGHQCLAADHAVLQSLTSFSSEGHPQHAAWQVAKASCRSWLSPARPEDRGRHSFNLGGRPAARAALVRVRGVLAGARGRQRRWLPCSVDTRRPSADFFGGDARTRRSGGERRRQRPSRRIRWRGRCCPSMGAGRPAIGTAYPRTHGVGFCNGSLGRR